MKSLNVSFIMKKNLLSVFVFLFTLSLQAQPTKVIYDTDMDSDVDDVGSLAMLHGFANTGEIEILGIMLSSLNQWSAATVDVINTHYGRPDIPIGNVQRFGVYHKSKYTKALSEEFKHNTPLGEDVPNATTLYRQLLASQPDNSVVIITVGDLTNLSKLLHSAADTHSALSGTELVAKKVKHLVAMGGRYPIDQDPTPNGNFKPDPQSTKHVAEAWPTKIIFTGGGVFANLIPTGGIFFDPKYKKTPMGRAYALFLKSWDRQWHHSADLISVYVAARGPAPYFKLQEKGYNHIFEDGSNAWRLAPDNKRHFLVSEFADNIDPKEVAKNFDQIMVTQKAGN
jgi:Inosine-uridine preferring nucleoside hydrolase